MSCITKVASDTSLSLEWARRPRTECIDLKLLGNSCPGVPKAADVW